MSEQKSLKEGQKLFEDKVTKSLYVIEKKVDNLSNEINSLSNKVDNLSNKVDIVIKVNDLRQSVDI